MAVICITGSDSPRLQAVENILMQAGMPAPHPLPKEEPLDIRQWQQHVLSSMDGESFAAIKDPGRLWELLAGEIILANIKSPLWGWCDPASIRFLDFWLGFAPEFKFLLVCQTPQQLLAERLVNADTPLHAEELLELWQSQHQEMLRFHHRNPERSLLINASDAVEHPDLLVAACNQHWKLSLAADGIIIPSSPARPDALASFFAYRVSSLQPEIDALNREIMATATLFSPTKVEDLIDEPQLAEILADYLALRQLLAEEERKSRNEAERLQSELSGVKDALTAQTSKDEARQVELQGKNAQLLLQLEHVQEELETVFFKEQELKEQLEVLKKEMAVAGEEKAALATTYDDLQQENELLLSQFHQTQEELETVFVKEQKATQQIEVLKKEMAVAGAERAALAAKFDGLQQELAAARLARDEQARVLSELQKQLDQAVKTKNEQTKLANDRQLQIDELRKDREQQQKQAGDLQKQKETLVREQEEQVSRLQGEMKELQQENELLLLQLHQTQEELETVFLKEQESMQQLSAVKSVQEEHTRVLSERQKQLDQAVKTKNEQTKLANDRQTQIDQLSKDRDQQKKLATEQQKQAEELARELAGQVRMVQEQQQENALLLLQLQQIQEELERYFLKNQQIQQESSASKVSFHRLLERAPKFFDYAELEVSPGNRGNATPAVNCRLTDLMAAGRHFPALAFSLAIEQGMAGLILPAATLLHPLRLTAGESELVITPAGSAEKLPQRLNQLATLATSDWSLVTALIRLLKEALAKPQQLQWNSPLSSQTFLAGLQELERQLEPQYARLRYDEIKLKREQVNPDYEHLWLEFANLSFQGEVWPHFEFRLSCAHVRPDYFGGFPKLEFPAEGSQAPFEGWFIEASDDFGDKLELRFSLPDKGMDLGVWERVTGHDRGFMKALTAELPHFLSALCQSGVLIARSWDDWRTMAAEMQAVMTQCDAAFSAISEVPPEEQQPNVSSAAGLHYDKVRLKREQVNPDYEHLWFEFGNLAFAGESWPHFEFRLSCAHVRPDSFGGFPKLEFPAEGSQAPFEGWFIEASDDFGDKLELRFSLPDKALDLAVWERLTEHDRVFMKALVAELPPILSTLRQSGVKVRRPWEEWTKMAEEMLPIVTNPPQLKGKKKSSFKKLLRKLKI